MGKEGQKETPLGGLGNGNEKVEINVTRKYYEWMSGRASNLLLSDLSTKERGGKGEAIKEKWKHGGSIQEDNIDEATIGEGLENKFDLA